MEKMMTRSATEVMHDVIYAAVIDAVVALKASSGGLPNTLLRDMGAIHANTTFADLPKELQAAINASVRGAFNRLLREGYNVSSGTAPPPRPAAPRHDTPRHDPGRGPRRPSGDRKPGAPGGGDRKAGPPGTRRPSGGKPGGGKPGGGGRPGGGRGGPKPS